MMHQRWPMLFVVFLLVLSACGDGGTSNGDDAQAEPTTVTEPSSEGTDPDGGAGDDPAPTNGTSGGSGGDSGTDDDDDPEAVSSTGTASVTLDGQTYVFAETGVFGEGCTSDLNGVYFVQLALVDDAGNAIPSGGGPSLSGSRILLVLLHEGTDPEVVNQQTRIEIEFLDEPNSPPVEKWVARAESVELLELEAGSSQVDQYTIDGLSASGTATFFEEDSWRAFVGGGPDPVSVAQGTFEVTCAR